MTTPIVGVGPIVVVGPTASGKSDVAMAFATAHPGSEIVAVDAMQVYRRMDIGTAKPTPADRAAVAHHCLDLADPADEFTVAQFTVAATAALDDVSGRGGTPVVVGGTGLYLRALTDPMDIPGRWPAVRSKIEARLDTDGVVALHGELAALDPLAASRMEPTNERRVVRALEVTLGGGRPFSSYGPGVSTYEPTPFRQVGIAWEREALARRIEQRVARMMSAGLLAEVAAIDADSTWSRTARQALGYKELLAHLHGDVSLDEAVATTIVRTRQFAVRQIRWFRRDPRIRWVQVGDDPVEELLPVLRSLAEGSPTAP